MKLRKMQRGPYEWLRGTAALYWRDLTEPGGARAPDRIRRSGVVARPARRRSASRERRHVPRGRRHDVRRLERLRCHRLRTVRPATCAGSRRASSSSLASARRTMTATRPSSSGVIASSYAAQIAELATGVRVGTIGLGADPAVRQGAREGGDAWRREVRTRRARPGHGWQARVAFGDLEPVAPDGVIEDRVVARRRRAGGLDRSRGRPVARREARRGPATIKLRARRIGSGVASYALRRFNVVLEGPTASVDDDLVIELKETREGVIVAGLLRLEVAEWASPAARTVDTQRRLQARPDADPLLGHAQVGGLSLKMRDREAYQRGIDASDLIELAAGSVGDRDRLRDLAAHLRSSARPRARAGADGRSRLGVHRDRSAARWSRGRVVDDIVEVATADAAQVFADHARCATSISPLPSLSRRIPDAPRGSRPSRFGHAGGCPGAHAGRPARGGPRTGTGTRAGTVATCHPYGCATGGAATGRVDRAAVCAVADGASLPGARAVLAGADSSVARATISPSCGSIAASLAGG